MVNELQTAHKIRSPFTGKKILGREKMPIASNGVGNPTLFIRIYSSWAARFIMKGTFAGGK